jgi:hypothetical protein
MQIDLKNLLNHQEKHRTIKIVVQNLEGKKQDLIYRYCSRKLTYPYNFKNQNDDYISIYGACVILLLLSNDCFYDLFFNTSKKLPFP